MYIGIDIDDQEGRDGFLAKYSGKSFRVKGVLRISWDISLKYNKIINIMLFLDKSCAEAIDASFPGNSSDLQRQYWWPITSPYQNDEKNYRLTEELLGKDKFKTFFATRFGCRRVAVEGTLFNFDHTYINPETNPYNQSVTKVENPYWIVSSIYLDFIFNDDAYLPTASLKDFKTIDITSIVISDAITEQENWTPNYPSNEIESQCYSSSGAFVMTSSRDMYVNMRDEPSSKDGKIIQKLIVQEILYDDPEGRDLSIPDSLWFEYQKEVDKFILSHKEMMKPSSYTIFAHDILPGDWCKVSLYRFLGNHNFISNRSLFRAKYPKGRNICETMNEEPSTITLAQGYIHASQLSAFSICSANSVKRK